MILKVNFSCFCHHTNYLQRFALFTNNNYDFADVMKSRSLFILFCKESRNSLVKRDPKEPEGRKVRWPEMEYDQPKLHSIVAQNLALCVNSGNNIHQNGKWKVNVYPGAKCDEASHFPILWEVPNNRPMAMYNLFQ